MILSKTFDEYLSEVIATSDKLYYTYLGINRKDYPKWEGWKIIFEYKNDGIAIKEISDERLDILVRNFHYLIYLDKSN